MPEATTEQAVDQSTAVNSSTAETTETSADSSAETQATASTETQTNNDDAALAKFAKGQGIEDLSELSERELSLLKMARDNKSAYDRTKQNQAKLEETSNKLASLGDEATDVQKLAAKVADMEFAAKKSKFFEDKDPSLEPVMAQIVSEKVKEFGNEYGRTLLNDLPTLYGLAQIRSGKIDSESIAEAAKKEERASINKNLAAGAADAHAVDSRPKAPVQVTSEWIRNEYDPKNPEHRALVDSLTKQMFK